MKGTQQDRPIQYDQLLDRLISDFRPARMLWSVSTRLAMWLLLEISIIVLLISLKENGDLSVRLHSVGYLLGLGIFILIGVATATLALRTSIPGREATRGEWILISATSLVGIVSILSEPMQTGVSVGQFIQSGAMLSMYMVSLAAVPWVVLFQAVRRGVPLQPGTSGGLVGAAAFSFAFVTVRLVWPVNDSLLLLTWQILPIVLATGLSILAGTTWLHSSNVWRKGSDLIDARGFSAEAEERSFYDWLLPSTWSYGSINFQRVAFRVALTGAAVLLVVFLRTRQDMAVAVPDFDLAIDSYGRFSTNFRPNVPSDSLGTLLKAYIEHGMPAYMWDFGPDGYKLVGGRFDTLPDGSPITYTLFRGNTGSIICLVRATEGFNPPPGVYEERRHYLFYSYRGYSVCLSNLGDYGTYICVLVARMPMKEFVREVLAVAP